MERLLLAARQAGFSEIETLEEPAAAIQEEDVTSGLVVALDFGGGTFDVAVVDYRPDEAEVIALARRSYRRRAIRPAVVQREGRR